MVRQIRFAVCLCRRSPELRFLNMLLFSFRLWFAGSFLFLAWRTAICRSLLDFNMIPCNLRKGGQLALPNNLPRRAEPARPQSPAANRHFSRFFSNRIDFFAEL